MINRIKKRHIALLTLLVSLSIISLFYLQNDVQRDRAVIRPYQEDTDFKPLVTLINQNQFWLAESSNLNAEKLLRWRAPHHDPKRKGEAKFYVIEDEGLVGGFISFHKESPTKGFIWLVAVDKKFRGRGFGTKLMKFAINELKEMNAQYITLAVREMNKSARALYEKLGFVVKTRYEKRGMIIYILRDL